MDKELCFGFYETHPLWVYEQFGVTQFKFPDLDLLNFTAQLIPEKLRLGHKMEYVFEQLLQYSKTWEVLAKNILVDHGKTRLGELDFLLKNRETQRIHHVELAYKFYIINPEITEPIYRLMGPNKRDMFYTKIDKLRNKQFPLLFSNELTEKLHSLELNPLEIQQQACFKAQLFSPYGVDSMTIRPLNKKCIQGRWIRFDDFNTTEFKKSKYYITYKQEWVLMPSANRLFTSHYETLLNINLRMLKENAPMLWMRKPNGQLEKLFIVWWK
ncbi:DUF1853 family protein [Croceitalea rosinachiae]|uniref:DUF1853 family protein n=1 Tax=Croceitalea rosinachiae TaxID=3075596 RepID=A0ABU3ADD1_9FLAO|nr:DUF1853 family protein [Croceitalea sp. F388]MDT0607517.1 DUF1853 family protein [Croceitalea sp. F388]